MSQIRVGLEEDFDFLGAEYRAFYNPERGTAFQAPMWLSSLHRQLGVKLGASQRTITFRNPANGKLLAVLPLVLQRSTGVRILQTADFGVCDYNTIVADKETFEYIVSSPGIRKSLRKQVQGADLLMIRKVRSDGFDLRRLFEGAHQSVGENAAYSVTVGDDFDHWRLKGVSRSFTKELGRKQRQTEREIGPYEHRELTEEAEIRAAFDFLREMKLRRFEDDLLKNPDYFAFYLDYAITGAKAGEATTYGSYLNGQLVAVLFGLTGDGVFHATMIAVDVERFERISPGIQLLYRVIEMRHRQGHTVLDVCLGNPGYKSHFRPVVTEMQNITLSLSIRGMIVAAIYHHAKPLKNLLRKGVSNVR